MVYLLIKPLEAEGQMYVPKTFFEEKISIYSL